MEVNPSPATRPVPVLLPASSSGGGSGVADVATGPPAAATGQESIPMAAVGAPAQQRLQKAVENVNARVEGLHQTSIRFLIRQDSGEVIVRVVDKDSGEVIRQIPPEDFLDAAERMSDLKGLIFSASG